MAGRKKGSKTTQHRSALEYTGIWYTLVRSWGADDTQNVVRGMYMACLAQGLDHRVLEELLFLYDLLGRRSNSSG